jgi:hypothetical protein
MATYRFVLQGCDEANIAAVNKAALAGIPGIQLPIESNAMGYYVISVDSETSHDKVLTLVKDVFEQLRLTVAETTGWTPSKFGDLS